MNSDEPKSRLAEFKDALKIDRDDMDTMLVQQQVLYHEAMDEHAMAVSRRDQAKMEMDRTYSETYLSIRRSQAKAKDKPSETTLKHMVETDDNYLKAQETFYKLKRRVDRWEAIVTGFKDRSYMLREYSNRQVSMNFMDSSGGKRRSEAAGRMAEENKAAAGAKRKRVRVDDDD